MEMSLLKVAVRMRTPGEELQLGTSLLLHTAEMQQLQSTGRPVNFWT